MKICTKCNLQKSFNEFGIERRNKDGLQYHCKLCGKESRKKYKESKRTYDATYHKNNKEKISLKRKIYADNHKKEKSDYDRRYYEENKIKKLEYHKRWREVNKNKLRLYQKQLREQDLNYKLSENLRNRINQAIKNGFKSGSAVRDLGCSIEFLKQYLESKFQLGMTWDNWGKGHEKWQIDHKIPLSSFDLTDREEFLKACHYTNLQPLWMDENLKKGNKLCQSQVMNPL